jgi:hypothetical protein
MSQRRRTRRTRRRRTIDVKCSKGHYIGTATVRDDPDDGLLIGPTVKGLRSRWEDEWQHDPVSGATVHTVTIECPHCNYRGHCNYSTLAAEKVANYHEHPPTSE